MAVSPLRAVIAAHVQGGVNRARKQLGGLGVVASALVVAGVFLLFAGPFVTGITFLGYLFGDALDNEGEVQRNLSSIAVFVSTLSIIGGVFGGLGGVSRQLPWESLQAFPVSARALFAAELVAGATEVITVAELLSLVGVCLGITWASPHSAPFLLWLAVSAAVTLLSVQLLVGSLAQRISKQARVMVVVLPVLAVLVTVGSPQVLELLTSKSATSMGEAVKELGLSTPAGLVLEAARETNSGHVARAPLKLLPSLLLAVGALLVAYLLVSREKPLAADLGSGPPKKLWTFVTPAWGVARLQWETLSTSLPGRVMLLMPLFTIVLIRGPLATLTGRGAWVVPASFLYAGLASTNLLFNQFGLDRHGVKALLLLPLDELAVLQGKRWAFAAWQAVQGGLLLVLLLLTGHTDPFALLLGAALGLCSFLVVSTVGQFMSIWQPHPLAKSGMRGSRPPLVVVLVTMVTVFGSGAGLMGLAWVLHRRAPQLSGLLMLGLAAVLLGLSQLALRFNAQFLKVSRERVVESLAASA